jgi:hypothetical protein
MYQIYCLTFKSTGKSYIGFTGIGVMNRVHKHYVNATYGIDSHLYRAIRLYGIEDIEVSILFENENKEETLCKEKEYIKKYDSVKNGYNETSGGIGGWSVPDSKLDLWKKSIRSRTQGLKNPNSKNISNAEIIEHAIKFFLQNNKLTMNFA